MTTIEEKHKNRVEVELNKKIEELNKKCWELDEYSKSHPKDIYILKTQQKTIKTYEILKFLTHELKTSTLKEVENIVNLRKDKTTLEEKEAYKIFLEAIRKTHEE